MKFSKLILLNVQECPKVIFLSQVLCLNANVENTTYCQRNRQDLYFVSYYITRNYLCFMGLINCISMLIDLKAATKVPIIKTYL